ncbi:hypothetical protein KBB96_09410 [Luteolibacter ambystomatis]|uniref:Uncharacterized protein n=1 Tax=Luteolibacter ambystomatis TaxID=2824561 RepID=A0A975PHB1_9BACT|nr:hypothetical protein [Luteolibacter ambystomatis]QUE53096.1 hypothetical protein KBB96_09410 [Luteolibacter ambystomatis]
MKTVTSIQLPALLALFSLTLGTSATTRAQQPEPVPTTPEPVVSLPVPTPEPPAPTVIPVPTSPPAPRAPVEIELSDPFTRGSSPSEVRSATADPSAEQLDAQARILFARNETESAIELQYRAVEKARLTLAKCTENLARYQGKPVDGGPIEKKLRSIIIPAINFQDTSLEEAVEFLRLKCAELDGTEKDPAKKGVNFVIGNMNSDPFSSGASDEQPQLTVKSLVLRNLSAADVLTHLGRTTGTRYTVESGAVLISR